MLYKQAPGWLMTPGSARVMLSLTSLCLAGNHVIARSVHEEIPAIGLSFWRWVVGALILAPFVLPNAGERCAIYRRHIASFFLLGFLIVGSTTVVLVALNFTTAINVSLINAIQPMLTVVLAILILKDRVSKIAIVGIASAFAGAAVMLFEGEWTNVTKVQFNKGDLIALMAMLGFSLYALNLWRIPSDLTMLESLFGIVVSGSVMLLPFYIIETSIFRPVPINASTVLVILALALLVSVFGNLMWNLGNRIIGPGRAAVFINLIPLFGAMLASAFLGERVQFYHWMGGAFICLGIWFIVGGFNPIKSQGSSQQG